MNQIAINRVLLCFLLVIFQKCGIVHLLSDQTNVTRQSGHLLTGEALNRTAGNVTSGISAVIIKTNDKKYHASFQWDNISLVGSASTYGTVVEENNHFIRFQFEGEFDCGGLGSWPEGTVGPFTASLIWNLQDNIAQGTYVIDRNGRLPRQEGELYFTRIQKTIFEDRVGGAC